MTRTEALSKKEREAVFLIAGIILMMDDGCDEELVKALAVDFSPETAMNILNLARNRFEGKRGLPEM